MSWLTADPNLWLAEPAVSDMETSLFATRTKINLKTSKK